MASIWSLDACCLLNILASGCEAEILRVPHDTQTPIYIVVPAVVNEVRYMRRGGTGPDAEVRDTVDLAPLFMAGLLRLEALETDAEFQSFVTLATQLDEGEAATCALALARDYGVITDDRKARHLLNTSAPTLEYRGTPELLKAWSETSGIESEIVAAALRAILDRARYMPPRSDALRAWWDSMING